jgi:hypothetical protein
MGANTFPSHNQSLTRESLTRLVHSDFLVTFSQILGGDSQELNKDQSNERNEKSPTDAARGRAIKMREIDEILSKLIR